MSCTPPCTALSLLRLAADRAGAELLHLDAAAALGRDDLAEPLHAERDRRASLHHVAKAQRGLLRRCGGGARGQNGQRDQMAAAVHRVSPQLL
jgi:hypothetical protein